MATLKKYDLDGKEAGEVAVNESLLDVKCSSQVIKEYLMAIRKNARQWSACTQTRAQVNHSKKKPFAQKGTGNARQGFLGSPQFKGGGRVHTPQPKFDQHWRINKTQRRLAIRKLLSDKIKENQARILDYKVLEKPSTKTLANFLNALNIKGKRVLFLAGLAESKKIKEFLNLTKSLRNIPKVEFTYVENVNGYNLALCEEVVVLDSAFAQVEATLGGKANA